jgi:hypothetical protein
MEPTYFVVDMDGVLLDSIEPKFERSGISGGTKGSNAYREFGLYLPLMSLLRKTASKHLDSNPQLKQDTINFTKQMQQRGLSPVFQTRNPTRKLHDVEKWLREKGIEYPFTRYIKDKDPGTLVDEKVPAFMLQDDPMDAIKAAMRGITVILIETSYNSNAGKLFSAMSKSINVVHALDDNALALADAAVKIYVVRNFGLDGVKVVDHIMQHSVQKVVSRSRS